MLVHAQAQTAVGNKGAWRGRCDSVPCGLCLVGVGSSPIATVGRW
ncbi:hypothetical protein [Staphylococcus aureus]|nr:hypothetical protein [Staphylococcus aureus]